ncbi:MAG: DUF4093 domain-containing protein [Ruminococcaceae bacterium]|nr:DUF4093 domain-containing protein [Oscillospiraceae bacterium]
MIKINEVIVVEGKSDKIKLERLVDAVIIETGGFRIFKDTELRNMLRDLAEKRGLIILTDSDSAGFAIRNAIIGSVDSKYIKNAYISEVKGKERRKRNPSKEGLLGVEGVSDEDIFEALRRAGVNLSKNCTEKPENTRKITKTDLFEDGFTGSADSSERRKKLEQRLNLPTHLSTNKLLEVLNVLLTYEEYKNLTKSIF